MAFNLSALALLKQEIAEKKRALQALEEALANYERQYPIEKAPAAETPQIPFSLDVHENGFKKTLRENIITAINTLGDREFSVIEVYGTLRSMGVELNGQHPKNRIIMIMRQLEGEGLIAQTYRGKGSAPHRFKAKAYA